ncbi:unnamed protein product [Parnassius apollo]|uniref:(apollo) hypothetical protein n=1 Tax=Parnassius apollo TaxID=110799 RepID=A0A8S3WLE6_PARAO|nr:unnamed protein product [Parnassius apollo]
MSFYTQRRMLVSKTVQLTVLTAAVLWGSRTDAATSAVKLCGRKLGEIMSRVCHAYNSPSWDVPTVVEQPAAVVRRRRQTGIADECCTYGCTWEQLSEYCAVSANSESPLDSMESHMIENRSAESSAVGASRVASARSEGAELSPAAVGSEQYAGPREVGRARSGGYGRAGWRRRCRCRGRRSGRRRPTLMGNMVCLTYATVLFSLFLTSDANFIIKGKSLFRQI